MILFRRAHQDAAAGFFLWNAKKKKNVTKCPYIVTNEGDYKKDFSVF